MNIVIKTATRNNEIAMLVLDYLIKNMEISPTKILQEHYDNEKYVFEIHVFGIKSKQYDSIYRESGRILKQFNLHLVHMQEYCEPNFCKMTFEEKFKKNFLGETK